MIEIISRKFKPTETDQEFMDRCKIIDDNPPATWYNTDDIVTMEYNELAKAIKANDHKGIEDNIIHLSVALLRMWREMYHARSE